MSRDKKSQLHHSVFEHDRLCTMQQNAVFQMTTDSAGQNAALDVAALADQVFGAVAVADPLHVLLDDRPFVQVGRVT